MNPPTFANPVCASTDPDAFFPEYSGWTLDTERVASLCRSCEYREPCLEYALYVRVDGIWGGTSRAERDRIRKQRGISPLPIVYAAA